MTEIDKMQINTIDCTKTVFFVRHAKSCWDNNLEDFNRPINKRGYVDANLVSNYLINKNINPEIILCSSAVRTRLTAEIFIKNLNLENVEIKYTKALYDFNGLSVLNVLKQCDNSIDKVLFFGHNHALTYLANSLGSTVISNVSTSGFVQIDFKVLKWENIEKGTTKLTVFAKDLK